MHSHIQSLLYEYLRDELTPAKRREVEKHLEGCTVCLQERDELRAFLDRALRYTTESAEVRGDAFWKDFAGKVERRIQADGRRRRTNQPFSVWEAILSYTRFQRGPAIAFAALALIALASVIYVRIQFRDQELVQEVEKWRAVQPAQPPVETVSRQDPRMAEYFRKSKVLLVGLTNMKMNEDQAPDFSAERRASRDLIQQAVYLKSQPLDVRSAHLINDLEKILIELSNLKEENNLPNVEIIRGGIHQENLLFKIRMAESFYDSSSHGKLSF